MKTKEERKELIFAIVVGCVVKEAGKRERLVSWKQKSDHLQCCAVYESNMINMPRLSAVWKLRPKPLNSIKFLFSADVLHDFYLLFYIFEPHLLGNLHIFICIHICFSSTRIATFKHVKRHRSILAWLRLRNHKKLSSFVIKKSLITVRKPV